MSKFADKIIDQIRVKPGSKPALKKIDQRDVDFLGPEKDARAHLEEDVLAIDALQDHMFSDGTKSLLVILQGTDTSGKDGTIRSVFSKTSPLGMSVNGFKKPNDLELSHDFLWRVHAVCPRHGSIGIFNRSHYEDVLIGKVRKLAPKEVIEQRYEQINAFEQLLVESGTTVLKFMLHISKKEQGERLQERLDDPTKNWKFNPSDLEDRGLWDDYQAAYEVALARCSTKHAPWYVVPADRKWARNVIVAAIVRETLENMGLKYPKMPWKPSDFKID